MQRKKLATIGFLSVISLLTLAFVLIRVKDPVNINNGQTRNPFPQKIGLIKSIITEVSLHDIIGSTDSFILFSTNNPEIVLSTDINGDHDSLLHLKLGSYKDSIHQPYLIYINKNHLIYFTLNRKYLISYNFRTHSTLCIKIPGMLISRMRIIDSNHFVFRQFRQAPYKDLLFSIYNPQTGQYKYSTNILPLLNDGGIATDGMLLYDDKNQLCCYMYFYNNQIVCFDTAFQIQKKITTIGRNDIKKVHVVEVGSKNNNYLAYDRPLIAQNKFCCIDKGRCLILSTQKAANDTKDLFKKNYPLDVYQIKTTQYLGTFYIPREYGTLGNFFVAGNTLVMFYPPHRISYYRINLPE